MDNAKRPTTAIEPFLKKALNLNCYTKQQYYNFKAVLDLTVELLAKSGTPPETTSVEAFRDLIPKLLNNHTANSAATTGTIRSYAGRINRLIADFLDYNEGDIAAWKKKLAVINANAKPRKKPVVAPLLPIAPPGDYDPAAADQTMMIHPLRLSGGRSGLLKLPATLSKQDIDRVWAQLLALRGLVEAQAEATAEEDDEE